MTATALLRLATVGGRADGLRIGLTTLGAAGVTVALVGGATVLSIGAGDGPYSSSLLQQPGLHPGVVAALWLLCLPLLAFLAQCSRVGAPARDRRLAAMRMAGAGPRQVATVAAAESGLASLGGAVLGLGVYLVGRVVLDRPVVGEYALTTVNGNTRTTTDETGLVRALPTDVLPPWWALLLVVLAVPALVTGAALLGLRRTAITPFGVLRGHRTQPPRVLPLVLLVVGVGGMLATSLLALFDLDFGVLLLVLLVLLVLTAVGLVLGAAATTAFTGRLLAERVSSPAVLIAARWMIANPFATSRAGSAVLVAVLIAAGAQVVRANFLAGRPADDGPFFVNTFRLVDLVLAVALAIAAAGLLVSAAEGIVQRRRTLAALVAAGVPRGTLARATLVEVVGPLVVPVLVAALAGALGAFGLFGRSVSTYDEATGGQLELPVPVPWLGLGTVVVGTLAAAAVVTSVALLFLRRATDVSELRAAA